MSQYPRADGIGMTSQRTRDRLVRRLQQAGIKNMQVLAAIRQVPRHLFVDEALASRAYEDTALPIGHQQTISQPWVVARMSEALLAGDAPRKVLEVGTGSGYQTAILAQLVERVYSCERIKPLAQRAQRILYEIRARNVTLNYSDGRWGWPEHAPYDAIIVTAAPKRLPEALLTQVKTGGRIIAPVGDGGDQSLICVQRTPHGYEQEILDKVSFVPLRSGLQ